MRRYLLDTNAASHAMRHHPAVRGRLEKTPVAQVAISAVTEAELYFGLAKKGNPRELTAKVQAFLAHIDALAWDSNAARIYGELRFQLDKRGLPIGPLDTMIAAHALAEELILVTADHDFGRVPGLKIEDWGKP